MGGNEADGHARTRVRPSPAAVGGLIGLAALGSLVVAFPPFRVVPLRPAAGPGTPSTGVGPTAFDPAAEAGRIWQSDLPAARLHATDLAQLAPALRASPETARTRFAKSAGLGAAYFFVRGSGRVVARDRNLLRVALTGAEPETVAVRIGPVFGNTVRDGCGLLDVNAFPGLQEFNALSAELNALVERTVLPPLRADAVVGATVGFVGCAEAPEGAADAGEPLLTIIPVHAEVRR